MQTAEPAYIHQHDENTSLTSQKTSRTQASMLTKSAPTPSGSGSGSGASGSTPQQKQSETTGSTTISASAKYAEYISNLEKYQHPPPSKRHVTFIKYRGRQCTIGMLVIFALLVIGLVVAPVVYFTGKIGCSFGRLLKSGQFFFHLTVKNSQKNHFDRKTPLYYVVTSKKKYRFRESLGFV